MPLLKRLLGALAAIALMVAAFFLVSILLAVAGVVALALWGWLSWRARHRLRAQPAGAANVPDAQRPGEVIEGEYRVERDLQRIGEEPGKRPS